VTAPRYEVLSVVGRGGFGTVYRARMMGEEGFSREVALKVLNEERAGVPALLRRLKDEARILGLVRHRAIVHVDGLVKLGGHWTVVMEFVEGVHLRDLCRAGAVPPRVALEIVSEVAAALDSAYHTRRPDGEPLKLLHRDVKPTNVQVTSHGEVKVLDFGIAKGEEGEEPSGDELQMGTPGYMSPERLDWIDGPEGDVYALGVVLWEIVMSRTFGRTSSHFARHARGLHTQLEHFQACLVDDWGTGASLAEQITTFLRGMLEYNAERRPTARQVERRAMDLRDAAQGERLRDYAERVVPGLLEERHQLLVDGEDSEHLTGTVLLAPNSGGSLPPVLGEKGFPTPPPLPDEGPTVLATNPDLLTASQLIDPDEPAAGGATEFIPRPDNRAVRREAGESTQVSSKLPGGEATLAMSDDEVAAVADAPGQVAAFDQVVAGHAEPEPEPVAAFAADSRAANRGAGVRHGNAVGLGAAVMAAVAPPPDALGAPVAEGFGAPPAYEPPADPAPSYDLARRVAWGVALFAAMAVGALLGADLLRPETSTEPAWKAAAAARGVTEPVAAPAPLPEVQAPVEAEPVVEAPAPEVAQVRPAALAPAAPVVTSEPDPVPAEVEEPPEAPEPEPVEQPIAVAPEPAPAAIAPPAARAADGAYVAVVGDAQSVRLVGRTTHAVPGPVPAGTYTVKATFAGMGEVSAGSVTVAAGGSVTLDCNGLFTRCGTK